MSRWRLSGPGHGMGASTHQGTLAPVVDFPETPDIETSSDAYAARFSGYVGSWFLKVQEEATLRMLAPFPGAKILDVGGGHGQLTDALVRNGYEVTVLGSSDQCKVRLQKLIDGKSCAFKVGNILELPYRNQTFDVVVSYRLLPHIVQWKHLTFELARVAQKAVIVDYPALQSVNYIAPLLFRFKKHVEGNTRPFTVFKESEIIETFKSHNFTAADRFPEFCLPMALYRALQSYRFALGLEKLCRSIGLTRAFGSPVILKLVRRTGS
jgi:2-polyprenyl-3-methyl-5-hydroxy-6-metoxy-1,4-benzoquinol methylase